MESALGVSLYGISIDLKGKFYTTGIDLLNSLVQNIRLLANGKHS